MIFRFCFISESPDASPQTQVVMLSPTATVVEQTANVSAKPSAMDVAPSAGEAHCRLKVVALRLLGN